MHDDDDKMKANPLKTKRNKQPYTQMALKSFKSGKANKRIQSTQVCVCVCVEICNRNNAQDAIG